MNEMMNDGYINMREMLSDCISDVKESAAKTGVLGIPTGFQPLDNLIGGFEKGKVYVIGGRPCMGKEEFMLSMMINIILESKLPVLAFSTNHMKSDYIQRLLAMYCDIPVMHLFQGNMEIQEWKRLDKRLCDLLDAPLFMHDSLDLPLNELTETARNCIRERDVHIIFIDCLQMIDFTNEGDNPFDRVAKVMLSLKQYAHLNKVPIIVGSMLSGGIEYRDGFEGKRPQLMDLMNSSFIECLADVIMMVHRPEYYHFYQDEKGRDLCGRIEIIVKKNALKPLDSIFLNYHDKTGVVCERKKRKSTNDENFDIIKPDVVCVRKNSKSTLKPISLKDLNPDNEAVKKLIKAFDLEEEIPF